LRVATATAALTGLLTQHLTLFKAIFLRKLSSVAKKLDFADEDCSMANKEEHLPH